MFMISKIKTFLRESNINYNEKSMEIFHNNISQIQFTIKNFFKKDYNFLFIESNDVNEIENIAILLSNKEKLFSTYVYLFCKTELKINDDKLTYIGANGNQIIECVYYNKTLNVFKYNNDADTPKIIKQLIKYLTM